MKVNFVSCYCIGKPQSTITFDNIQITLINTGLQLHSLLSFIIKIHKSNAPLHYLLFLLHVWEEHLGKIFQLLFQHESIVIAILCCFLLVTILDQPHHLAQVGHPKTHRLMTEYMKICSLNSISTWLSSCSLGKNHGNCTQHPQCHQKAHYLEINHLL